MVGRGRGARRMRRARYAVRDWAAYDRALARRGDITVWVSPDAVAAWRAPAGRRTFSDAAIEAALTVRAVYHLALRAALGDFTGALGGPLPDRPPRMRPATHERLCAEIREAEARALSLPARPLARRMDTP